MKKTQPQNIKFSYLTLGILLIIAVISLGILIHFAGAEKVFSTLLDKFNFTSKLSPEYLPIIGTIYYLGLRAYYYVLYYCLRNVTISIENGTILDQDKNYLIDLLFVCYVAMPILMNGMLSVGSIIFAYILYQIIKIGIAKKQEKDKLEEESKYTI